MKKLKTTITASLIIIFLAACFSLPTQAAETGNFIIEGGVLTCYTGTKSDVVIPKDLGITAIGDEAFADSLTVKTVVIPVGVTTIGDRAFYGCANLKSLTISGSVKTVGTCAFTGSSIKTPIIICGGDLLCYVPASIVSYAIPDYVTVIGGGAFANCSNLISVEIPDSVTSIGDYAFSECRNLTAIEIPDSVVSVGTSLFYHTGIDAPIYLKNGSILCYVPSSIKTISIPETVTAIGSGAFEDCKLLTSLSIPDGITEIGASAFSGCSGLTSIRLPEGLTSIPAHTFFECSALTSIAIPNSVESIGEAAFSGCEDLTSIAIPPGVSTVGNAAFTMTHITSPVYAANGHILCYVPTDTVQFSVPDSVTVICGSAFDGCTALADLSLPESVTNIGDYAFHDCRSLTAVVIPTKVSTLGKGVFAGCAALGEVSLPTGMTQIGAWAFSECASLNQIILPDFLETIGTGAFQGCVILTSLTLSNSVFHIDAFAFEGCHQLTLYVLSNTYAETFAKANGVPYVVESSLKTALPSSNILRIDGEPFALESFNIEGNNYFKLRDLAMVMSGTSKEFDVSWDGINHIIHLTSGLPYTPVGGELSVSEVPDTTAIFARPSLELDGVQILIKAYNIGDYHYFKLRDLAEALDYSVDWNDETDTISINTLAEYIP